MGVEIGQSPVCRIISQCVLAEVLKLGGVGVIIIVSYESLGV